MTKRIFDIFGSLLGLLFITPFFPFIALAILIEDGFPVFVKLDRVSKGKVFGVYKFRSMIRGADEMKDDLRSENEREGPFFKIAEDPRITNVGKFLRKLRVDEFPQLINVLRGDLSLVGPRPHEPEEILGYPKKYRIVPMEKAGVTGLSQIRGASSLHYLKELKLDKEYLENKSLWMDFKILFWTVWIFFTDPTGV